MVDTSAAVITQVARKEIKFMPVEEERQAVRYVAVELAAFTKQQICVFNWWQ